MKRNQIHSSLTALPTKHVNKLGIELFNTHLPTFVKFPYLLSSLILSLFRFMKQTKRLYKSSNALFLVI